MVLSTESDIPDIGKGANVAIVSGTGAGATTNISEYNSSTGEFTFSDQLSTPLDSTSTIIISRSPSKIAIVDNKLDGREENVASDQHSASVGIQVYPGGSKIIIDSNDIDEVRAGIGSWSFPAKQNGGPTGIGDNALIGAQFYDIKGNSVEDSNVGIHFLIDPAGYLRYWSTQIDC